MKLRVEIVCPDCNQRTEVHISGDWDIKAVRHQCVGDLGRRFHGGHEMEPGEFAVIFEPPRRAF